MYQIVLDTTYYVSYFLMYQLLLVSVSAEPSW